MTPTALGRLMETRFDEEHLRRLFAAVQRPAAADWSPPEPPAARNGGRFLTLRRFTRCGRTGRDRDR